MTENKIAYVAKLFNKQLEEEFIVKLPKHKNAKLKAKFSINGLAFYSHSNYVDEWIISQTLLQMLILNEAEIVED